MRRSPSESLASLSSMARISSKPLPIAYPRLKYCRKAGAKECVTRELFPDPETPDTAVKTPTGNLASMFFKLLAEAFFIVIKALGFDPEDLPHLFDAKELQVTKWGTVKTDFNTMETNLKGVFAAGDIVRGASLVVWAIKDGRDAASSMKTYLENMQLKKTKVA